MKYIFNEIITINQNKNSSDRKNSYIIQGLGRKR